MIRLPHARLQVHTLPQPPASPLPAATAGVRLSLVLPACRVAPWLEICVDPLPADAPAGLGIIVADDGTPGETPAIAAALAARGERVRVIHQASGGVSAARSTGPGAARGTWVGFIAPDDRVVRGWARGLLAAGCPVPGAPGGVAAGRWRRGQSVRRQGRHCASLAMPVLRLPAECAPGA